MLESTGTARLAPWLNFGVSPERSTVERTTNDGVTVGQTAVGSTSFANRTTRIAGIDVELDAVVGKVAADGVAGLDVAVIHPGQEILVCVIVFAPDPGGVVNAVGRRILPAGEVAG
jgi:hypothetical protein